ncbi:hypothetical protein K493DRAFT_296890 [Basidiobolus meristosporus CBS 931.73]|uniref:Uncharacterized protein n=1 Tax=Basidiobolus meristosporus CBS 931.73 TaxID=1314790 RepID=A0A1Y1Z2T2_9FUNG|nr:hypothetical protein K493DRAFT_296890 [Basidiobolus meristosporus CBS 931.73]|eukprot:ORY04612.1 hypothetical protein K493DRAFT_296890 [Basidiobolus meristosporus CBS 931.73]
MASFQLARGILFTLSISWFAWGSPFYNIDPAISLKAKPVINFSPDISPEFKGLCVLAFECERIHRPVTNPWIPGYSSLENAVNFLASRLAPPYRGAIYPPPPPYFPGQDLPGSNPQIQPYQPILDQGPPAGPPGISPGISPLSLGDVSNLLPVIQRLLAQNPGLARSLPSIAGGESNAPPSLGDLSNRLPEMQRLLAQNPGLFRSFPPTAGGESNAPPSLDDLSNLLPEIQRLLAQNPGLFRLFPSIAGGGEGNESDLSSLLDLLKRPQNGEPKFRNLLKNPDSGLGAGLGNSDPANFLEGLVDNPEFIDLLKNLDKGPDEKKAPVSAKQALPDNKNSTKSR